MPSITLSKTSYQLLHVAPRTTIFSASRWIRASTIAVTGFAGRRRSSPHRGAIDVGARRPGTIPVLQNGTQLRRTAPNKSGKTGRAAAVGPATRSRAAILSQLPRPPPRQRPPTAFFTHVHLLLASRRRWRRRRRSAEEAEEQNPLTRSSPAPRRNRLGNQPPPTRASGGDPCTRLLGVAIERRRGGSPEQLIAATATTPAERRHPKELP